MSDRYSVATRLRLTANLWRDDLAKTERVRRAICDEMEALAEQIEADPQCFVSHFFIDRHAKRVSLRMTTYTEWDSSKEPVS